MKKIIFIISLFCAVGVANAQSTLAEGFEIWPPAGWEFYLLGDAVDGWRDDFNGNSYAGTESAYSSIDNAQCDNWMVTPAISVISADYELTFWEIHAGVEYYDNAEVLVSSGSGDPESGDFVEVLESNILNTIDWEQRVIDLSAYAGETIYVAFRYEGTYHAWNIDEVSISPASYTDAALTDFVSPLGVSESPGVSTVSVELTNTGTTTLNELTILWQVNEVSQLDYVASALDLAPGESVVLDLGTFDFDLEGSYDIVANVSLMNDFDSGNNEAQTTYDIAAITDGAIVGLTPEGLLPLNGLLEVKVSVSNLGENTINVANIEWSVNDELQPIFSSTNLGILPGETSLVSIGSYDFQDGFNELSATLYALGDTEDSNDSYETSASVNTFIESFEGAQFPPEGWSVNFGIRDGINFDLPVDGDFYYVASTDNNFFGEVTDTLYTPILNIEDGDHFTFYIKTAPPTPANHSLVYKDDVTGDVTFIQNITNSPGLNNWAFRDIDISSAAGNHRIGIVTAYVGGYGESKFDFFTSDAELFLYENDLKILNGDIDFLALQSTPEAFECKIRNSGVQPVSGTDYTVKLMEVPNIELASVEGVSLNSWDEAVIEINHTFTEIGQRRLYFEIEYDLDENDTNNTYREADLSVVPSTSIINPIGSPDYRDGNVPFTANGSTNSLGEDDMSQLLFFSDEFESAGEVYGIAYKYDNFLEAEHVVHYPLQVWIAQSSVTNLDGGWLPNDELTLVFDGIVEILPGFDRDLYIPFSEPVLLNGIENVVIKSYQYDPEWPPSIFRMLMTSVDGGPTRAMGVANVFDLDPNDPPEGFFSFSNFTYTRFVIDPSVIVSELSGVVYDSATSEPIENALISIAGSNITVTTDENGNYVLPELPYGDYTITASVAGYSDEEVIVTLNTIDQTQDFFLDPLPEVAFSGSVFGSNAPAIPLEFVSVNIFQNGELVDSGNTNVNGEFSFPVFFGNSDYEVQLSLYGYFDQVLEVSIDDTDLNLENIILVEEFISPLDVAVEVEAQTTVNWVSPKFSAKENLQQDFGVASFSYTNEPNENVWLGNVFEIDEITTLTSVEFLSDVYENAIDFLTIDIIDVASNTVIATSEPFLVQTDSLHTIDIPNIVVYDDFAAMVHWQNNAASTNSLAIDYSDPAIPNAAVIRYPGQPLGTFSTFIGGPDAPNMSFLVRVNTLDEATPITNGEELTYNVYRGLASEFPDFSNWDILNSTPVQDISLIDLDLSNIDINETYRYAVEAIYTEGLSEVTFSNEIEGQVLLTLSELNGLSSDVLLFPNPASHFITLNLAPRMNINQAVQVIDALGKTVMEVNVSSTNTGTNLVTLDTSGLSPGIFYLQLNTEEGVINKKFIIE